MMKNYLLIVFLFFSFCVKAQESVKENVNEKKTVANVSLNQKFSSKVLNVYQENSKTKIEDLFSYFQLLTNAQLSDELKKEVIKNIYLIFQNKNELVIDLTSQSFDKIPLNVLIQKLLISEPILFSVSDENNYNSVDFNSWKTEYIVSRTKSGLVSRTKISQKVYFYETSKSFGTESKVVYSTFLGEM